MKNITNPTHFIGLLNLGFMTVGSTGIPSVTRTAEENRLKSFITTYEEEFLSKLMNDEVLSEFMTYCQTLIEGGEPEIHVPEYDALFNLFSDAQRNPIACYVYFKFLQCANDTPTQIGVVRNADADAVSPKKLMIRAWNEMARRNRKLSELTDIPCWMLEKINDIGI